MGKGSSISAPSYQATSYSNPYASAYFNSNGQSGYMLNDFLTNMNSQVEATLPSLYNQLLNPSLNNPTSQARMNSFINELEDESYKQFENSLNALSNRGLLRSSAVNDMANKLNENQTKQIGNYANQLISSNITDTNNLIQALLNQYQLGASFGNSAYSSGLENSKYYNDNALERYKAYQQALNTAQNNGIFSGLGAVGSLLQATPAAPIGTALQVGSQVLPLALELL